MLSTFLLFVFVSFPDLGLDQFIVKRFDGKVKTDPYMWYREFFGSSNCFFVFIDIWTRNYVALVFPRKLQFEHSKMYGLTQDIDFQSPDLMSLWNQFI